MRRLVCQAGKKRKPRPAHCSLLPMATLTTLASLIKACTSACCELERGRGLHADAEKKGLASSLFVGTSLIRMYGKCHSLSDADATFMDLHGKDVFSWNAILSAYLENDRPMDALLGFRQFLEEEEVLCPDVVTFTIVLRACGTLGEHIDAVVEGEINCVVFREIGRALHSQVQKKQMVPDAFVNDAVVSMYAKCGCNREAIHVLSASQEHSVTSWNSIMAAYLHRDEGASALLLYSEMRQRGLSPDVHTFLAAIRACTILAEGLGSSMPREIGQALHVDAGLEGHASNVYVANALLSMYGKCGDTVAAEDIFSFLPCRDVVSWNTMLSTYVQHLQAQNALRMFQQMLNEEVHPDMLTFVIALQACGSLAEDEDVTIHSVKAAHEIGQAIHAHVRKEERFCSDIFHNTLISMYGKCGDISEAENVFQDLHNPGLVSYNAMLSAYVERGKPGKGLQLFGELKRKSEDPNQLTFVICLQACGSLADDEDGRFSKLAMSEIGQAFNLEIWKKGLLSDVVMDSALVSMYGKIGGIPEAEAVFHSKLIQRNSVTWNVMISAYIEHGYAEKALELYAEMEVGLVDEITLVCALQSCSEMSNLRLCEELHFSIVSTGLDTTSNTLMNTLVNAYGCCASQRNALAVFSGMSRPDLVSWNACIASYAHHGNSLGCFRVFQRMQFAAAKADCVTMLFLLYACSHDGKVDEGLEYFGLMIMAGFGPSPGLQHYTAMLDLLGRNGDFRKIEHALLRAEMPMEANVSVWLCVLGACRTHRNMELGNRAFANAVNLKPDNASAYLLLSNLYVDCCYDEVNR